jgi:DNA polymerase-3 subunit alpha
VGIKGLGQETVKHYLAKRSSEGPFNDFTAFIRAVQGILNQRHITALIHSGACDGWGLNHRTMIENLEAVQHYLKYQDSLTLAPFVLEPYEEYTPAELQHFEKEVLGWNLTYHPLKFYQKVLNHPDVITPDQLQDKDESQTLTVLAMVSKTSFIKTKKGEAMAFFQCDGFFHSTEAVCFPSVYQTLHDTPQNGEVYLMKGQIDGSRKKRQFRIDKLQKMIR